MNKLRTLFFILILVSLLAIPIVASAEEAGLTWYCSTTKSSGGDGTQANPFPCMNQQQFHAIVIDLCRVTGPHYLYQLYPNWYVLWKITTDPACAEQIIEEGSYIPPTTGVNIPTSMIFTLAAFTGFALLGGGLVLRNKRTHSAL